jgi:hypothetical protein
MSADPGLEEKSRLEGEFSNVPNGDLIVSLLMRMHETADETTQIRLHVAASILQGEYKSGVLELLLADDCPPAMYLIQL